MHSTAFTVYNLVRFFKDYRERRKTQREREREREREGEREGEGDRNKTTRPYSEE